MHIGLSGHFPVLDIHQMLHAIFYIHLIFPPFHICLDMLENDANAQVCFLVFDVFDLCLSLVGHYTSVRVGPFTLMYEHCGSSAAETPGAEAHAPLRTS